MRTVIFELAIHEGKGELGGHHPLGISNVFSTCLSLSDSGHYTSLEMELPSATSDFYLLLVTFLLSLRKMHFLHFPSFQTRLSLLPFPPAASLTNQSESSLSFCLHLTLQLSHPKRCQTDSIKGDCFSQPICLVKLRVALVSLPTLY